jgi:hypothetical protein
MHAPLSPAAGVLGANHPPLSIMPIASRILPCLFVLAVSLRAEAPALLQEVVDGLVNERKHWAFTQTVREYDGDRVKVERLERFDPARGWERRWQLLRLNGRTPSAEEVEAWSKKKNRARKRPPKELAEYVDLAQARVSEETAERVSYEIPFRRSAGGLFPGEKVDLTLTINKQSRALERAQVGIDESFSVALGLAKIIDLDLDLEMPGNHPTVQTGGPPGKAQGTASAVVNRLGRRIEYQWSEFIRRDLPPGR